MELKNIKNEYETQLREATKTEVTNQYGIMENSVLTITVIEARYISPADFNSKNDLYVLIECANQTAQTKHIENNQNPIWDESFQFDIYSGKEEIKVSIMDKNMMTQDTVIGVLYTPIANLSDQVKIEDWYNLESPMGGAQSSGRVRLQLWWIHSKIKLIEDRIMQTEEDVSKILEDKKYYMDKVKQLREPFPWMEAISLSSNKTTPTNTRAAAKPQYATNTYNDELETEDDETKSNPLIRTANKVGETEKVLARGFEKLTDNIMQGLGIRYTPWYKLMYIVNTIYAILTFGTCFIKTDFVNLTLCS